MSEIDYRLLERRIDVIEHRIRPLEDELCKIPCGKRLSRERRETADRLRRQIMELHREQLGTVRVISRLLRREGRPEGLLASEG